MNVMLTIRTLSRQRAPRRVHGALALIAFVAVGGFSAVAQSTNSPAARTNSSPAAAPTSSSSTNVSAASRPTKVEFASFKLITDRNIFSPTRSGSRPMRYETRTTRTSSSPRAETFSLVGTMAYEQGELAFFDSSVSSYRKALKRNDSIAGFKVVEVAPNHVKLSRDREIVTLKVGMLMRQGDNGGWRPAEPGEVAAGSRRSDDSESRPAARPMSEAAPAPSGAADQPPPAGSGVTQVMVTEDGEVHVEEIAAPAAPPPPAPADAQNDVLRRLMQRREQELNR